MVHRALQVPLCLFVGVLVGSPSAQDAPQPPLGPPAAVCRAGPGRVCAGKPQAALDVTFEVVRAEGEQVEVTFGIHPRASIRDVSWELALFGTVSVLEGATTGDLAGERASGRLLLHVPADGSHKTAELVVHGTLDGSGPGGARFDEPVATTRTLEWERPASFLPRVQAYDAQTGQRVLADRLPWSWTPAGSPGAGTSSLTDAPHPEGFLVTGSFLYEDKDWAWFGWTGSDPLLPIRHADVTVLDADTGAVLGLGTTEQDGSFAVRCEAAGALELVVQCESDTGHDPGFQRIRVTPLNNIDYVLQGPVFTHDGLSDLDVGTVTSLKVTVAGKEANPFNVFDVSVYAWEWLLGPEVDAGFTPDLSDLPAVRNIWPHGPNTFAHPWGAWMGDDDVYDDAVILHELGHVAHAQYSDHDTLGLPHFFGDSDQDPPTSITEGFATCFTGLVLDHMGKLPRYVDSSAGSQFGGWGLRLDIETVVPYVNDARGSADEVAVCAALYDLMDDVATQDATPGVDDDAFDGSLLVDGVSPVTAFWQVFTRSMARAFALTHNDTWDGWVADFGDGPHTDALRDLFADYGQDFYEDAYEPDDGPLQATSLPVLEGNDWHAPFTLYHATDGAIAPGARDEDWFAHELVQGSIVTFVTRYPDGAGDANTQADTQLDLFAPDGSLAASDEDSGPGRNARVKDFLVPQTGTWRVRVSVQQDGWPFPDDTYLRRYGRYDYRARYVFENHPPVISVGPVAAPAAVQGGGRTWLDAEATDADEGQTLEYLWRPLDGGAILGGGPSVTFAPPAVTEDTRVRVQLVVRDELGATSAASYVEVLVRP